MQSSLLVFELSLAYHLSSFVWDVIKVKLGVQRLLLAGVLSVVAVIVLISLVSIPQVLPHSEETVNDTTPTHSSLFVEKQMTREEIENELVYWESVLEE